MATADWKASLSAVDRYETVQKLIESLPDQNTSVAVALEQKAYENSCTLASIPPRGRQSFYDLVLTAIKDQYKAASSPNTVSARPHHLSATPNSASDTRPKLLSALPNKQSTVSGICIGSYKNCVHVSDGATSSVFRCNDMALKVITSTRKMEPHNPQREAKILSLLRPPCIPLLDVFRDQEQRFVLRFPFMPMTLSDLLDKEPLTSRQIRSIFIDVLHALQAIHGQGIIHRDIKPSAILLQSPSGPAFLSDFGTAWEINLASEAEPYSDKILDIGTGPYRAPEVLFGDKCYGPPVDMWALGAILVEAARYPHKPLFDSRSAHEDGNQLGLILSIFKTIGTPTPETWPEALYLKVSPFVLWTVFPPRRWEDITPTMNPSLREVVAALVRYGGSRATATKILEHNFFHSANNV